LFRITSTISNYVPKHHLTGHAVMQLVEALR